jgi:translation initiation factor SUI1
MNATAAATAAAPALSDIIPILNNNIDDIDNDGHANVLGTKIVISVQRGKNTVTKIEGIPDQYSLAKLLKKLKAKDTLSCGGHIAKDKDTGREFIVLQGSFSTEVSTFLIQQGIAEADCIVHRG